MATILISGGEGFLGGRLASSLKACGHDVRVGARSSGQGKVVVDLACHESLDRACDGVEIVIHLAAMNQLQCEQDVEKALDTNILGTYRIFSASKAAGVKQFFYFSTAQIYGSITDRLLHEDSQTNSRNSYALTHEMAERCIMLEPRDKHTAVTIIRLTNTFGPPEKPEVNCWMLFVNNICREIIDKNKIVIKSSPYVRRDFIPLSDVCDALKFLIGHPKASDEIFNICSGNSIQLIEMATIIQERAKLVLGVSPTIEFPQRLVDDNEYFLRYSNRKIKSLGFNFKNDMKKEIDVLLRRCSQWFV